MTSDQRIVTKGRSAAVSPLPVVNRFIRPWCHLIHRFLGHMSRLTNAIRTVQPFCTAHPWTQTTDLSTIVVANGLIQPWPHPRFLGPT